MAYFTEAELQEIQNYLVNKGIACDSVSTAVNDTDEIPATDSEGNGKLFTVSQLKGDLKNNVSVAVDEKNNRKYVLKFYGTEVANFTVPVDKFIKSVSYNESTKKLVFVFYKADETEETVYVDISSLVDTYTAGNGLQVSSNKFSIKIKSGETLLRASADGAYTDVSTLQTNIDKKLPLAGGTMTGTINSQSVIPKANDTYDLGSASLEFLNGYIKYLSVQYLKLGGKDCNIVGLHNGLYREACLYSAVSGTTGIYSSLADLYSAVHSSNFDNIYIGDYILVKISGSYTWTKADSSTSTVTFTNETVKLVVTAINYYIGRYGLLTPHLVLMPEECFANSSPMNNSNTTAEGYKGSQMYTTVLPAYATALSSALGGHLVTTNHLISTSVNTSAVNQSGGAWNGASSGWGWNSTNIILPSEVQVYGSAVWSQGYDTGDACTQLPYFALRPDKLVAHLGYGSSSRYTWWLSGVAGSSDFCVVGGGGSADYTDASNSRGVRPIVLFG